MLALKYTLLALTLCAGCANYDLSDIDTSESDQACVRQCTGYQAECLQGGPAVGSQYQIINACKESLRMCVNACPPAEIN